MTTKLKLINERAKLRSQRSKIAVRIRRLNSLIGQNPPIARRSGAKSRMHGPTN
jgi:hypothetical protein